MPQTITRLGLRYINRVPRESSDQTASEWLRQNDYTAPVVLRSAPGFLSRVEARLDAENRLTVTVGDRPPGASEPHGAFILDIDRIVEREVGPDPAALKAELDRLHDHVWEVFSEAKSDRFERHLLQQS